MDETENADDDVVEIENVHLSSGGDSVFTALDTLIGPSSILCSNKQPHGGGKHRASRIMHRRPDNWRLIADYYKVYRNIVATIKQFGLRTHDMRKPQMYWVTTIGRWMKDVDDKKELWEYGRRPVYGVPIDNQLLAIVKNYNNHAVPMTNMILRIQLLTLLQSSGQTNILDAIADSEEPLSKEKKYRFGDQWAIRFYNRHNLSSRVATTKMREELPAKYAEKLLDFKLILSLNIYDHNVPDALILGMDETNTMFVPQISRTRCAKGTRRVRLIGIGHDKAQVTVTPTINAEGDVVTPAQVIFGGKTKRCHPNAGKPPFPDGIYYDHSESHWQNPETMIRYITSVLVPYRIATIARLGLPVDQKMILILDLHYSHKDKVVLAFMVECHIIPVYIPAGCTDLHQVCDVVVNKPYKNGVVKAFVDYVSAKYCEYLNRPNPDPNDVFQLSMAGSVMKPLIPGYVARGMAAIDTPQMKEVIKASFYKDSLVGEARQLDTYAMAKLKYPQPLEEIPIPEEREAEENLGPVADDSPVEGAVDGDGIFEVQIGGGDPDPTDLIEENGPEEIEDEEIEEEVVIELPKAKKAAKKKRKVPEEIGTLASNTTTTTKVSRTGRQVLPNTLHGGIVPNRYSTIA